MMGQPMMVAPTAGAPAAPMMAMPQVVAPNAQVMARDFETTKGKLFEQGTAAYSSGTFDCCSDGIDAPMWCGNRRVLRGFAPGGAVLALVRTQDRGRGRRDE